jgi:hypothetical protein
MVSDALPRFASEHPALCGALGGVMVLIGLALFGSVALALGVGVPFGIGHWLIWRPGGPARRWRAQVLERSLASADAAKAPLASDGSGGRMRSCAWA